MILVDQLLEQKRAPLVMGVINCTPDSFYANSRKQEVYAASAAAEKMIRDGADIIDIGGESTRPGAAYVEEEEELKRIIPVVRAVARLGALVSVDTRKSRTAYEAIQAGASIINDISALKEDESIADVIIQAGCGTVLMHKKGIPLFMQENPFYNDAVQEIKNDLEAFAAAAVEKGIDRKRIIIDPGIGFGKRVSDNLAIIKNLAVFRETGYPVLIGCSRKSFIGAVTGRETEERLSGSLAAGLLAALNGAHILRVHDVKETKDAIMIMHAVSDAD